MIIVGELINAGRKAIKIAIETERDEAIKKVAQDQCGSFGSTRFLEY